MQQQAARYGFGDGQIEPWASGYLHQICGMDLQLLGRQVCLQQVARLNRQGRLLDGVQGAFEAERSLYLELTEQAQGLDEMGWHMFETPPQTPSRNL